MGKMFSEVKFFFKNVWEAWNVHRTEQMGASLAFYSILSLPSLFVFIIALGSIFYDNPQAILGPVYQFFPPSTADAFNAIVMSIFQSSAKKSATIFGFIALFVSASAFFEHLMYSLNIIFELPELSKEKFKSFLLHRLWGFFFIVFIEFLLFMSVFMNAFLKSIREYIPFSGNLENIFFQALDFFFVCFFPFILFLFIFRFLIDVKLSFRDNVIGAIITTILFVIGNFFLNLYLANFADFSTFGAASTFVMILVWAYYVSQILLLGAECTSVYSGHYKPKNKKLSMN